MSEAGLPMMTPDTLGERQTFTGSRGIVRAVHPELWRVDFEAEDGSYLTEALVIGPYFPEVHTPEQPSLVGYMQVRGGPDTFCWPMPHRRLNGPQDLREGPERRYYHLHHSIFRAGDLTMRFTRDNRFLLESEAGDWLLYDQAKREFHLHAPTLFVGETETERRIEFQQDDSLRAYAPLILIGTETSDRIEYREGVELLLQAPLIKLTAEDIILDPVSIKLGHENATERVMLGDLFMALYNSLITLFNAHQHTNVQTGSGLSGPPSAAAAPMTEAHLSDVTRVSKTGT
jgi:hypothetical protein